MTTQTEALKLALEALELVSTFGRVGSRDVDTAKAQQAITAIKEALAQPEQEPVGMYRNKCADGSRCLHGCHTNESCFTSSQPQPEQEAVECDCNQGQSCHVCDPYFPFDSAPQTTRLTQKTTTNDVAIGVDVTEDGTHVTAMRMRPDGINIVIYSQFHPLAQPEQEPVADLVLLDRAVIAQAIEALDSNRPTEWSAEAWLHSQATVALNVALNKPTATTPPQRTWVGLTNDERMEIYSESLTIWSCMEAVEAKLRGKNA